MALSSTGGPWLKNEGQLGFVTQFGGTTFCRDSEAAIVSGDGEALFPYLPALNVLDDDFTLPDVSYGYITFNEKGQIRDDSDSQLQVLHRRLPGLQHDQAQSGVQFRLQDRDISSRLRLKGDLIVKILESVSALTRVHRARLRFCAKLLRVGRDVLADLRQRSLAVVVL